MLSKEEREFANLLMNKLYQKEISKPFQHPVDPKHDNCPDYDLKIQNPMCLDKVKEKLNNSQYDKLEDWVKDVDLIWKNAIVYNTENQNPFLCLMAEDLSIWFRKRLIFGNNNQAKDWVKNVLSTTKKMHTLLEKEFYENSTF